MPWARNAEASVRVPTEPRHDATLLPVPLGLVRLEGKRQITRVLSDIDFVDVQLQRISSIPSSDGVRHEFVTALLQEDLDRWECMDLNRAGTSGDRLS